MLNSKLKMGWFFLLWLLVYGMMVVSVASSDKTTPIAAQKIDLLFNQGEYQKAYQLAEILSSREIGNPAFDLSLGRSALAVQKFSVAVMAFERVLMADSANPYAKLGLARSYYNLKMYDKAKIAIQALAASPNTLSLKNKIQNLSTKINQVSLAKNKSYRLYGNLTFGFDNNVAATTDEDYVNFIDLMGGVS